MFKKKKKKKLYTLEYIGCH